MTSSLIASTF